MEQDSASNSVRPLDDVTQLVKHIRATHLVLIAVTATLAVDLLVPTSQNELASAELRQLEQIGTGYAGYMEELIEEKLKETYPDLLRNTDDAVSSIFFRLVGDGPIYQMKLRGDLVGTGFRDPISAQDGRIRAGRIDVPSIANGRMEGVMNLWGNDDYKIALWKNVPHANILIEDIEGTRRESRREKQWIAQPPRGDVQELDVIYLSQDVIKKYFPRLTTAYVARAVVDDRFFVHLPIERTYYNVVLPGPLKWVLDQGGVNSPSPTSFADTFPYVSEFLSAGNNRRLSQISLNNLRLILDITNSTGGEAVAVGPVSVPSKEAAVGLLLVPIVLLYLGVNLTELLRRSAVGQSQEHLWVGVYSGWVATLFTFSTIVLLPMAIEWYSGEETPSSVVYSGELWATVGLSLWCQALVWRLCWLADDGRFDRVLNRGRTALTWISRIARRG